MGLFDRWRAAPEEPWRPPPLGSCGCEQHAENMRDLAISQSPLAGAGTATVGELLDRQALTVRLALPSETWVDLPVSGQRTGPYHWVAELGDAARLLYDDEAPVHLDDCLAVQAGVERVALLDVGRFAVGAPTLCPSGVQAAVATALSNPRVRASA
jgi:hypothetical protein